MPCSRDLISRYSSALLLHGGKEVWGPDPGKYKHIKSNFPCESPLEEALVLKFNFC